MNLESSAWQDVTAGRQLGVLHLEDSSDDRELVRRALESGGIACAFTYAGGRPDFERAVEQGGFDLILSDYTLPAFDGNSALALARSKRPEVPYLFVSGTIGEERAIESLKSGATDYVLKHHLERLVPAVRRALREAGERARLREAETALRESEERFRAMAESIRDVFWVAAPAGEMWLYVSPAYATIWGRPVESLRASPAGWLEAVEPADRARVSQAWAELARGIEFKLEYRIRRPDGEYRWIEDRGYPIRDSLNEEERAAGVAIDITERRQLEEQLRQSQKMEAIGQLAGGVAHDFNNLLTVINGHASLLLDSGTCPPQARESLGQIHLAGDRAAGLTRQLLVFGRKQPVEKRTVDLNVALHEVARMLRGLIGENVALEISLGAPQLFIHADVAMLEQVILNLVVNARDALPRHGRIVVATKAVTLTAAGLARHPQGRAGSFACLSVRDTGCGIPPAVLPHIFEPFFTTKEVGKGTGLGLATVFGIMKQHQGWVEVESKEGEGTVFEVWLPMEADEAPGAEPAPNGSPTGGGGETVLLVEDEESVREVAWLTLKQSGYRVLPAASGADALEVWRWHGPRISLLLTDMVMPGGLDGLALAEKLQREKPSLKVVFASGYSEDMVARRNAGYRKGHFLQKPYLPRTLAATVRQVLDETVA